jgi:lipopolysaccharide export system protein LptA
MTTTRVLTIAATALALLALPTMGDAQTRPRVGAGAISYGADAGEATPTSLALRGRAEVVQGPNRLRADVINGTIVNGDLSQVEASGNVYFVTADQTIRGDRAVYTLSNSQVTVTGDVIVTQGQNVMTGGRLTYNVETEAVTMAGGASSNGGRIRGVFYPERSGN